MCRQPLTVYVILKGASFVSKIAFDDLHIIDTDHISHPITWTTSVLSSYCSNFEPGCHDDLTLKGRNSRTSSSIRIPLLLDPSPIIGYACHWLREEVLKKAAVLLDFVQMRGGGPAQILWQLLVSAFLVIFGGNLDKIQKNSSFFRDSFPHWLTAVY